MSTAFGYKEALLGLKALVTYRDDSDSATEELWIGLDMEEQEGISQKMSEDFISGTQELSDDEVFEASIAGIKDSSVERRIRACAWLWKIAAVNGVTEEERAWVTKTMDALTVSSAELNNDLKNLPDYVNLPTY